MGNAEAQNNELGNIDLYTNQVRYDKFLAKKKTVYSFMNLIAAIVALVAMFALPIFRYAVKGNSRKKIESIMGDYTPTYIVQKFFANELGPRSILNTLLMVSIIIMVILAVYLVVASLMNLFLKKTLTSNKLLHKIFGYSMIEIVSTVFLVLLFASMIFCRVDVSGSAENLTGFWVLLASSAVMVCTSIPLSSK